MALCPSCGRENPEGFAFCGYCRSALPSDGAVEVRKVVTVLFTDLTGFTTLSERLDPEAVRAIQGRFLHAMKTIAERHGGTVEKFIGDAVMAVFGVPAVHEDDALRAVRAAVEMRDELTALNDSLGRDYGIELSAHTGVNTGQVVVEEGSADRLATGDAVNVAARLEQAAAPGEILIGEETYRLTRAAVQAEPAPATLKGKTDPVNAYRVSTIDPVAEGYLRRLDTPLVGREEELGEILASLDRVAAEARPELVTIIAPAGTGKSRLTNEATARASERGRVLIGRCLPYGDGITFWPVAEAIRQAAGIRDEDSAEEASARIGALVPGEDRARVVGGVAAAMGLGAGTTDSQAIQETFWAMRRLFEAVAEDAPLTLVIEDVHWAEPALLDLIEYLVEFTHGHRLLILATARPEFGQVRPEWASLGRTIVLEPLSHEQSERLVRLLTGDRALPPEVLRHVVETAEGNPLFVEELVRKLIEDGSLVRTNAHWELRGEVRTLATPGTINALLSARIDSLADGERSTIQRGAVVGRVFWWGAVETLAAEAERPAVGGYLRTLVRKGFIHPDRSTFGGEDAFAFGHILVRDAAYESTPKAVRADLHERFAGWLERAAGDRMNEYEEIVGYHLEQAVLQRASLGMPGSRDLALQAGARLTRAGLRAEERGDHGAAANLLQRAVEVLPADAPGRVEALAAVGPILMELGRLLEAEAALDQAVRGAEAIGDRRLEHLARVRRTFVHVHAAHDEDLMALWGEADISLGILESIGDAASLSEALALIGTGRFYQGRTEEALQLVERALEQADRAEGHARAYWARRSLGNILIYGQTPVDEALVRLRALLEDVPPGSSFEASMRRHLGALYLLADMPAEARTSFERAREVASALGLWIDLGGIARGLGELELWAGRPGDAEPELREGVRIYERIRDFGHGTNLPSMLASTLARLGRPDEARGFAELGERWLSWEDVDGVQALYCAQTEVALAEGDALLAVERGRAAVASVESTGYTSHRAEARTVLARALLAAGHDAEARSVLAEAIALAERKGDRRVLRVARGLLGEPADPDPSAKGERA
ncbi:MAG: AAA family ATPase [Actinobacteria bacterium]|nr:AAA family ATPase [Actinomycetota bacterium]